MGKQCIKILEINPYNSLALLYSSISNFAQLQEEINQDFSKKWDAIDHSKMSNLEISKTISKKHYDEFTKITKSLFRDISTIYVNGNTETDATLETVSLDLIWYFGGYKTKGKHDLAYESYPLNRSVELINTRHFMDIKILLKNLSLENLMMIEDWILNHIWHKSQKEDVEDIILSIQNYIISQNGQPSLKPIQIKESYFTTVSQMLGLSNKNKR